jgi:hypothetical protein
VTICQRMLLATRDAGKLSTFDQPPWFNLPINRLKHSWFLYRTGSCEEDPDPDPDADADAHAIPDMHVGTTVHRMPLSDDGHVTNSYSLCRVLHSTVPPHHFKLCMSQLPIAPFTPSIDRCILNGCSRRRRKG